MDFVSIFGSTFLLCFAAPSILLGIVAAFIGKSKVKVFGICLFAVGIAALGTFWLLYGSNWSIVFYGIVSLFGGIVGVAIAMFLLLAGFFLL
jgi:hypothetical protein